MVVVERDGAEDGPLVVVGEDRPPRPGRRAPGHGRRTGSCPTPWPYPRPWKRTVAPRVVGPVQAGVGVGAGQALARSGGSSLPRRPPCRRPGVAFGAAVAVGAGEPVGAGAAPSGRDGSRRAARWHRPARAPASDQRDQRDDRADGRGPAARTRGRTAARAGEGWSSVDRMAESVPGASGPRP